MIESDPGLRERARERAARWAATGGRSRLYFDRWLVLLALPLDKLVPALVDTSEEARTLRKCSPFAGEISPRERLRIWDEVRARFEGAR